MTSRPIFKSAQQAIAFSYMMAGLPAREGGGLGKMLDRMKLEETGIAEPRGEPSSISFAGLNEMEIRGQCAMVRSAVETMLPHPESVAIRSRFGAADIKRGPGGRIARATYGFERTEAMRQLSRYMAPMLPTLPPEALLLLIARVCGECEQLRPTFRRIEEECGSSKSALERAEKKLKQHIRRLAGIGIDRLAPMFIRDGLIPAEEEEEAAA